MRVLSLLLCLFLFSLNTHASIEILSVEGASNHVVEESAIKIYGGIAGTCSTGTTTCDSCATATGFTECNPKLISSTTQVVINFKVTSDLSGTGTVRIFDKNNQEVQQVGTAQTGVGKDDTATLTVAWGSLCTVMNTSDPSCATNNSANFVIGIDVDNNGLADVESGTVLFQVHKPGGTGTIKACKDATNTDGVCLMQVNPGDSKVVIDSILAEDGFPNAASLAFSHIRIYYSTTDFMTKPSDGTAVDLLIQLSGSSFQVANNEITGLDNDTTYYFRSSTLDFANNVSYFTDDSVITAECGSLTTTDDINCPYMATPGEVFGLLTEDLNCFVTTAAYGNPWHQKVQDFRAFRNRFLLPFQTGTKLVELYYAYGPFLARAIHKNETAKLLARVALWPLWLFAWTSLQSHPAIPITLVLLIGLVTLGITWVIRKQKGHPAMATKGGIGE